MANPAGESKDEILKLDFDRRLMLQFRGRAPMQEVPPTITHRTSIGISALANC
jgi:hypothetical protein